MLKTNEHIDSDLLLRLRNGDEKAFSIVFDTFHRYLYVMASRYLMSESYAEDAVQFTFMRLWEGRETFDFSNGIKNLLFTILKNHVLNEIRHNNIKIQKAYELAQLSEEAEINMFKKIADADFSQYFHRLIDQLPPQKKNVCLLKIEQGMTNQEIADFMHISVPTVKSHYTQAIKLLRSKINKISVWLVLLLGFFR